MYVLFPSSDTIADVLSQPARGAIDLPLYVSSDDEDEVEEGD